MFFNTNYCLMQVKSIAECSKGRILQYFQRSLSYHLSLRSWFCLFLRCRFTQVLLYITGPIENQKFIRVNNNSALIEARVFIRLYTVKWTKGSNANNWNSLIITSSMREILQLNMTIEETCNFYPHGWKLKISQILNLWNSNLKTCCMPTNH